jgi:hypothetical protein
LFLLAITVVKLFITNLAVSSFSPVSLRIITFYEGLFNIMKDVLVRLDKLDKGHNLAPSVKQARVRKEDTIHP